MFDFLFVVLVFTAYLVKTDRFKWELWSIEGICDKSRQLHLLNFNTRGTELLNQPWVRRCDWAPFTISQVEAYFTYCTSTFCCLISWVGSILANRIAQSKLCCSRMCKHNYISVWMPQKKGRDEREFWTTRQIRGSVMSSNKLLIWFLNRISKLLHDITTLATMQAMSEPM